MSSVAGNKIRLARRLGAEVLPAWIAEADGTPIMEERPVPDDFLMLPVGGTREIGSHKGYSLAVMVDVLSGVLAGTGPGLGAPAGRRAPLPLRTASTPSPTWASSRTTWTCT